MKMYNNTSACRKQNFKKLATPHTNLNSILQNNHTYDWIKYAVFTCKIISEIFFFGHIIISLEIQWTVGSTKSYTKLK